MLIYGICISDINTLNEEKAEKYLEELLNTSCRDIASNYFENKKDGNDINDWLYDYESEGHYGLAACLRDIIKEMEKIDIECDEPDGIDYLGISADVPWNFNYKTKTLSQEKFHNILGKYVSNFTDETLTIRWWNVLDSGDY